MNSSPSKAAFAEFRTAEPKNHTDGIPENRRGISGNERQKKSEAHILAGLSDIGHLWSNIELEFKVFVVFGPEINLSRIRTAAVQQIIMPNSLKYFSFNEKMARILQK